MSNSTADDVTLPSRLNLVALRHLCKVFEEVNESALRRNGFLPRIKIGRVVWCWFFSRRLLRGFIAHELG